jgi:hypothetical protein
LVLAAGTWRSRALVARSQRARRARAHHDFPWARTPRPASTHRSGRGGSLSREPTLRPSPLAPRASRTRDGRTDPRRQPMASSPYRGHAAPPYRDLQSWRARQHHHRLCLPTKSRPPPPRAQCALARAALRAAITVVGAELQCHLFYLRSSHSSIPPRLCRSSHPHLLLRPSRNSPEQQPPAAAAAGLRRAHPPTPFLPQVST